MAGNACVMVTGILSPEEERSQLVFALDVPFSVALSLEKARTQPGDGNNFKGDVRLVVLYFCGTYCFLASLTICVRAAL